MTVRKHVQSNGRKDNDCMYKEIYIYERVCFVGRYFCSVVVPIEWYDSILLALSQIKVYF